MSLEIIDILTPAVDNDSYFVADTTGPDSVTTHLPLVLNGYKGVNAEGKNKLQKGDSFQLKAIGMIMPENFTLFKSTAIAAFPVFAISALSSISLHYFEYLNVSTGLFIPMENTEEVIDVFFDCNEALDINTSLKDLNNEDYHVLMAVDAMKVSMLGVPASLNGKTFYIIPYMKIAHSLPMV